MRREAMPSISTKNTIKLRVTVEELQVWSEWPTPEELKKLPKDEPTPTQVDKREWIETDQITTSKKASLAAYLRGLADELHPLEETKSIYRDR
jgi:hypothetical protein